MTHKIVRPGGAQQADFSLRSGERQVARQGGAAVHAHEVAVAIDVGARGAHDELERPDETADALRRVFA